jgi:hypothetical protein
MKTLLRLSVLLIAILISSSCLITRKIADPNTIILPLSDTVTLREGSIVYGLPRTIFTVVVEMERTIEMPGPYSRYANDLLGLSGVIKTEREFWSIEGLKVMSHEELDPSEFYIIESTTLFQTNIISLKKEGLILDLNPEIFIPADRQSGIKEPEENQFRSFDLGSDEYFLLQRDTVYKRVKVDSTFIRIPYIVEKKNKLSVEQLAEKAARRLMEMRDGKHLILTGEATVFPQNDAAINEMNRLEKEYTELFTGKTLQETRIFTFQIIPEKEIAKKPLVLFQFSEIAGVVTGKTKGGISVTMELIPEQKTKDLTIINKQHPVPDAQKYDKMFYRVPDVVNMKINMGNEVLFNSRRLIYQFGEVIQLPANYIIGK